jgi:hypothetical protein
MKLSILILFVLFCTLAQAGEAPAPAADAALKEKVRKLYEQLSSDEFSVRESAGKELLALGQSAIAIIDTLPKSVDAEVNVRVGRIRLQFAIEGVKTVAAALELRHRFIDDGKPELAAAATKKAESLGTPLEIADALRISALADYGAIRQGLAERSPQVDGLLRHVAKDIEDAVKYYDDYLKLHPNEKEVESHQTEASMILYSCRKYLTL